MTEERLDDLALEDVDTLIEIIMAVEAERDKLREALKSIRDMAPPGAWDDTFHQAPSWWRARVRNMHDAADEALQEDKDEV